MDPQMQRLLEKILDYRGRMTFLDPEKPEDIMPGLERAVASGFVFHISGTQGGLGDSFILTRKGKAALGLPVPPTLMDRLKRFIGR